MTRPLQRQMLSLKTAKSLQADRIPRRLFQLRRSYAPGAFMRRQGGTLVSSRYEAMTSHLWARHRWLAGARITRLVLAVVLAVCQLGVSAWSQEYAPGGFRAYALRHLDASIVAAQLRSVLPESAKILIDGSTNSVHVQGSERDQRAASELIRRLDQPASSDAPEARDNNQQQVLEFRVEAERLQSVADQLGARFPPQDNVRVVTNERRGQLLVLAPPAAQGEISEWLRQLGIHPVQPGQTPQLARRAAAPTEFGRRGLQLQNISWRDLEDGMQQVWGQNLSITTDRQGEIARLQVGFDGGSPATLQVDRRRNHVFIEAPESDLDSWERILKALDTTRRKTNEVSAVVPIHGADAAKIERAVTLLNALKRGDDPAVARAVVQREDASLSRRWGGHLIATIFQPEARNQQPADGAQGNQELGNQPADPPAVQVPDGQAEGEPGQVGLKGQVEIQILEGIGAILIKADPADIALVKKIIDDIIAASQLTEPAVEIYQLRFVNSGAVADLLAPIYEQVYLPRQGPVNITPLARPNALLLIGRPESTKAVISIVQQLDRPVPPETQIEVFRLQHMSALDAAQRLADFYQIQVGGQPGAVAPTAQPAAGQVELAMAPRPVVVADYRSNSLIVQASPGDLAEVAEFLNKIDVEGNAKMHEVRIFHLKNALAEQLAPVLQDAINGQLEGAGRAATSQVAAIAAAAQQTARIASGMQFLTVDAESGRVVKSGILFDVRVIADINSNALIVTGPPNSMELVKTLVDQLDKLPSAVAQIKVFTIVNGDATNLTVMLQQLFGQQVTAGQNIGQQQFFQALGAQAQAQGAAAGESSLVPLRFAVDLRTNSIIASGSEADLAVVHTVLARLDIGGIETRKTTVYRLMNSPAVDVANAISTILNQQINLQLNTLTGIISPFEQFEQQVIVVPEQVSNSLIISATPRYYDEVIQVIKDLDQRPPMVMIQVLIAEVQFDDLVEFGIEMGIQDSLVFDRGVGMVGFPFNQAALGNNADALALGTRETLAGQALSNLAVGRASGSVSYGGLVLNAGNESINVLLRALQDRRQVRILSRPQIMTLDNWQAFIQIGQSVPRITGSNLTPQGGTQNNVEDEEVGIIMRVTPRITPDGQVTMFLDAEKSSVGDINDGIPVSVDQFGNVVLSPRINRTTASTTLTARSGQTVVFAGLLTSSKTHVTRGVPILSDIPGIGRLFRFDSDNESRSELLIIMTPYIIKDDADYDWINRMEAGRMSWCWNDVVAIHNDLGLGPVYDQFGSPTPAIVYPDLDPTGSEAMRHAPEEAQREEQPESSRRTSRRANSLPANRQSSTRPAGTSSLRANYESPVERSEALMPSPGANEGSEHNSLRQDGAADRATWEPARASQFEAPKVPRGFPSSGQQSSSRLPAVD